MQNGTNTYVSANQNKKINYIKSVTKKGIILGSRLEKRGADVSHIQPINVENSVF